MDSYFSHKATKNKRNYLGKIFYSCWLNYFVAKLLPYCLRVFVANYICISSRLLPALCAFPPRYYCLCALASLWPITICISSRAFRLPGPVIIALVPSRLCGQKSFVFLPVFFPCLPTDQAGFPSSRPGIYCLCAFASLWPKTIWIK